MEKHTNHVMILVGMRGGNQVFECKECHETFSLPFAPDYYTTWEQKHLSPFMEWMDKSNFNRLWEETIQ